MSIDNLTFIEIAKRFTNFFQSGRMQASYKCVLLNAIIEKIIQRYSRSGSKNNQIQTFRQEILLIDEIAHHFYQFYNQTIQLKQLDGTENEVKIYSIVEPGIANDIPRISGPQSKKEFSAETAKEISILLHRHVLYALRKDVHIYECYNRNRSLIKLPIEIKDEPEFKRLLNGQMVEVIGVPANVCEYIVMNELLLKSANLVKLCNFLENLNPNVNVYQILKMFFE